MVALVLGPLWGFDSRHSDQQPESQPLCNINLHFFLRKGFQLASHAYSDAYLYSFL